MGSLNVSSWPSQEQRPISNCDVNIAILVSTFSYLGGNLYFINVYQESIVVLESGRPAEGIRELLKITGSVAI